MKTEVAIVGAGLAGLACARRLAQLGIPVELFEASDRVGGRVATDRVDGFLLDRGFQVLLDAYPEARRVLDFEALGARTFEPGALVRKGGQFWRVVDPWRAPLRALGTLSAPFVSLKDGLSMASLRSKALSGAGRRDARPTAEYLADEGFSSAMRESFFRPFFGGVTLDPELQVPAWYFLSLFGWFAEGSAVLPASGMGAIAEQLAEGLPAESIHLNTPVRAVGSNSLELAGGDTVECRTVVVATDGASAAELLGSGEGPDWLGTTTVYYRAERSPVGEAILVLNGEGEADGPVNHLCVLSDAQPSYAPDGSALISVSILGIPAEDDAAVDRGVRAQLEGWYGEEVAGWSLLRVDRITRALPRLAAGAAAASEPEPGAPWVCGDHVATPSIQGTLESGRKVAEALEARLHAGIAGQ